MPALWPYEAWVDFKIIDLFDTHGLVVSSGHKVELILISLPIESGSTEGRSDRNDNAGGVSQKSRRSERHGEANGITLGALADEQTQVVVMYFFRIKEMMLSLLNPMEILLPSLKME